jgi:hypothetical protein
MELHYRKASYKLPKNLEAIEKLQLENVQNYLPIYSQFLNLTDKNYNTVVLNSRYDASKLFVVDDDDPQIKNIDNGNNASDASDDDDFQDDPHYIVAEVTDTAQAQHSHDREQHDVFIKYSPLLDPIKYLSGKYDVLDETLMALPQYGSTDKNCHHKVLDVNNSAYVDGFFTFLSSKVMHAHNFVHGIEYYGAFVAHKRDFEVDVSDDLEFFSKNAFFNNNMGKLFSMDEESSEIYNEQLNMRCTTGSSSKQSGRACKPRLRLILDDDEHNHDNSRDDGHVIELNFDTIDEKMHDLFDASSISKSEDADDIETINTINVVTAEPETRDGSDKSKSKSKSNSYNSSRSSYSTEADVVGSIEIAANDAIIDLEQQYDSVNYVHEKGEDTEEECNDEDDAGNFDSVFVEIAKFPVNVILMEECDDTLDSLMECNEIGSLDEWSAILMQIIMTLIAYQKMFWFTHNDLHTNNVMFVETKKEFLYYMCDKKYYRVPTFGKIFKIIDFGRAVYKYKSLTICSDSFHPKGDAATQYNFKPYMNDKKPLLEPNPSFDLCRLACSMYDYFISDVSNAAELSATNPIIELVANWVKDDKGRNVLYKSSGEERYPDFKLYKMIARTVHNHVPLTQLSNPLFSKYEVKNGTLSQKAKQNMLRIDELPEYYQ